MSVERLELPSSALKATDMLREASREAPVLVFKKSPICGTSFVAEQELRDWLGSRPREMALKLVEIDVIRERNLARGISAELGIRHESPQALLLTDGELRWHASHEQLTADRFREEVDARRA